MQQCMKQEIQQTHPADSRAMYIAVYIAVCQAKCAAICAARMWHSVAKTLVLVCISIIKLISS